MATGGYVYHVLNRGVARMRLFHKRGDYEVFEKVMTEALARLPMRLLCYCLMPNHWHLLLWPRRDGDLSQFMRWLTVTHTQRHHAHRHTSGTGPIYQGRFKSFPVERDQHFLAAARYVERNPLRANLCARAEEWRWSSLWVRRSGDTQQRALLSAWPVAEPRHWLRTVNAPLRPAELEAIRRSVKRGRPFGGERWVQRTASLLGLGASLRPRGRPRRTRQ